MEIVIEKINNHFFKKQEHLKLFDENDVRVEGWFKGELIYLFNNLRDSDIIQSYESEHKYITGGKSLKIDFVISKDGMTYYIENKCLCISNAKSSGRELKFYFRDNEKGLISDFRKLDTVIEKNKLVIGYVYPKPREEQWNEILNAIPTDLSHWNCISNINDYPEYLFISIWKPTKKQFTH